MSHYQDPQGRIAGDVLIMRPIACQINKVWRDEFRVIKPLRDPKTSQPAYLVQYFNRPADEKPWAKVIPANHFLEN